MALKTRVKVSEVTNLHNGRYCAGMGVEMIGFPLDKEHPDFVSPERFKEISSWLAGIKFVAEINQSLDIDFEAYEKFDFIQTDKLDLLEDLQNLATPLVFKYDLAIEAELEDVTSVLTAVKDKVDFIIIESKAQLDAKRIDLLSKVAKEFKLFLGFGINHENVTEMIDTIQPEGISLKGGAEIKVGINDFDELADILEELDTDEFAFN
ncbi:phosphoribosylanthranilate isomerase [Sediminitomix flava]|uniref:phosphoribosylanthranilate isomerase n=1 Tax=Sediminitomix flava TaxID=379075 RepID=A0A315ZBV6_SEDFL|nr:phosphoribosylanthranilate isomerase [Sediminitomix flava]PWJ42194.1 phosphoribosylanthranilate isomerase [Sediminitomix flava]